MITIRRHTFETNSSSAHAITICANINDKKYVEEGLARWKQPDGSYNINVTLSDSNIEEPFTIRRYIPHYSINDKLLYLFATIVQHYNRMITPGPYKPYKYPFEKDNTGLIERMKAYEVKLAEWQSLSVHNTNKAALRQFEEHISELEENLSVRIRVVLFGEPPARSYIDENGYHEIPESEIPEDTRPTVSVKFNYIIGEDEMIHVGVDDDDWFSTGCNMNELFYHALNSNMQCVSESSWLLNPYDAILAGSDEQSDSDYNMQTKEAKRLITESWKNYRNDYITRFKKSPRTTDYRIALNPGMVVWPE